ncbi:hypothetical protein [Sporocytophaga myxococcoides]|uniref:hypothetical protein n=1 Tax=Sporocytophaga myxococcoides TaxID=153721 RepID=UPI0004025EE5|nr:hypothetical protein [Sporocytophaga myxococcoides]
MTELSIIESIIEKLSINPEIKFERRNNSELEIFNKDKNGFNILLQLAQREHTLHFGTFHWHYDNNEEEIGEMMTHLVFGLTGIARVKEFSKNGKSYKWTLQVVDRDGNWYDNGTMAFMNLNFWTKAEIKYLQNNLLPEEIFF